jgi:hypothetical protein
MAVPFKSPVRVRRALTRLALNWLTKPLKGYTLRIPNDVATLKRQIRKGDVLLVEGNERLSECIKYLTQSCWSHAALYVGDEGLRRGTELRQQLLEQFGAEANHLIVEALVEEGVVLSPLVKYRDFNLRVCRPYNLTRPHLAEVLDEVLSTVGYTYDLRNIFDLARYFLPVRMVPRRWRERALRFGSGEPTRVICSSMIGGAFRKVRFPIIPVYREPPQREPRPRRLARLLRRADPRYFGLLENVPSGLITPRDFDLSPYFEVVKFNLREEFNFDYRQIRWVDQQRHEGGLEKDLSER